MTNYDNSGKPKSPAAGVDRDGISTGDTARCMAIAMPSEQAGIQEQELCHCKFACVAALQ